MTDETIRVVDTETTGTDHEKDAVCEIATVDLLGPDWRLMAAKEYLVNPGMPMPAIAQAVHHISDADLAGKGPLEKAIPKCLTSYPTPIAYAAHKASFEQGFLAKFTGDVPWICTWKVALRLWQEAPGFKNQDLRYWLKLEIPDKHPTMPPHRALPDTVVTAHILRAALKLASIEQMIAWSNEPPLLPRCPIGDYRDRPWPEVDGGFLGWIVGKQGMDEEIKWNAQREIDRREHEAMAAERTSYVATALKVVEMAIDVDALRQWWIDESDMRQRLGIVPTSTEAQQIADACKARKTILLQQQKPADAA